ncbi:MmgE/PrpD family protein [Candidatus Entotheonella serta]|nr:MmgE/PrpD family protein [Candidatus Entotheonella serta]
MIEQAKMCLVDWMGVALGAHGEGAAVTVRRLAASWRAAGEAPILLGETTTPALAALVNGTMSHCLDYDDAHTEGAGHISAVTWAAALAMAGHHRLSGEEALRAFVAGFEVMARLGRGQMQGLGRNLQLKGFHSTSVLGRFGAAAVASVVLGLPTERVAHALSVAATTTGGFTASFGTMSKPFHAGKAAMDGILAAQLASEGFEAATHLLDAERGLQSTLIQDRSFGIAPVTYDDGWELRRNGFKPYACCRSIHASVDAARKLAPELMGARIERVHVRAHRGATVPAHHFDPQTPLQGKFSFPFCMALGLRGYPVVEADFSEARLRDPEIMAIVPHLTVEEVADQSRWESHLEVVLEGDEICRADQDMVRGHPGNPMTWEDMAQKFLGLVAPVLGTEARTLLQALRDVDKPGQLATVIRLIRRDNHAVNDGIRPRDAHPV